jgi:hypothetical protein
VLGLILPDGGSAVALLEDIDLVDDTDPTWRELVARAVDGEEGIGRGGYWRRWTCPDCVEKAKIKLGRISAYCRYWSVTGK